MQTKRKTAIGTPHPRTTCDKRKESENSPKAANSAGKEKCETSLKNDEDFSITG